MKLVRVGPGMLKSADGVFRVTKREYRLSGRPCVDWTVTIPALMPDLAEFYKTRQYDGGSTFDAAYEIAKGHTLARAKERLDKYLADAAAGTYGTRSRYGFGGDTRDVARIP